MNLKISKDVSYTFNWKYNLLLVLNKRFQISKHAKIGNNKFKIHILNNLNMLYKSNIIEEKT